MAQIKVSALTAKTNTGGGEELLINDGGTSKKVTIDNLLKDDGVLNKHIGPSAVGTTEIADNAITSAKIGVDVIVAADLANNSITVAELSNNAVTTAKILDDNVTIAKLNLISTASAPSLEAKGTSGATSGYITLNCEENTHGIKLLGPPHSANANYTLTFPNDDGNANQMLTTNGSGVMTWASAGSNSIVAGSVNTAALGSNAVTNVKMADNAVDTAEIAASAVETAKINNGAVTTDKLGADAVTAAKIADNAVTADHIGDNVINSEHYAADSIDAEHLNVNSVNTDAIIDDAVTSAHLAAGAVDATAIGNDVVNSQHYAAASIDNEHLADNAVGTAEIADDAVTADKLANAINTAIAANTAKNTNATHTGDVTGSGTLTIGADKVITSKILNANVTTAKIADDAVTYAKMQHTGTANRLLGAASAGAIGEVQVVVAMMAADSIDSAQYVNGSIDHEHLAADIVDGDIIADDAIGAEHIADDAIVSAAIADNAVLTAHIEDDQITAALMADNSINSDMYVDGSIDTVHIADAQVTLAKTTGLVGKNTIWIPSQAMTPTTTNGCSALTTVETTSGRPDMNVLDFDKDSDEFAQFSIAFPKMWNLGTVTFQVFWSGIAATTDCDWSVQGVAMNDNETIDVAYGTAVVVTDNAQGAVEELLVSAESGAVTIAGTAADNDLCYFRIGRDVSGDDMAGDARLHGIKIFYTTDALTDA